MPRRKSILLFTNAAIFILLEIAALAMLKYSGRLQDIWLTKGIHALNAKVWGGAESVGDYFSLRKTNEALAEENFILSQKVRRYEMLLGKDYATDRTAAPDTVGDYRYLPATIVKHGNAGQHNYLIIGKGSEDGVAPRSGIITDKGVIGVVDAVGRNYSYVLSIKNSGISVSSRIGREGAVGPLTWDGRSGRGAILSEIPLHIHFERGDTVYTSGYSSIFPPDVPLGTTGDTKIVNGATYDIKVDLFEDFNALRYVTVVNNINAQEIEELVKE